MKFNFSHPYASLLARMLFSAVGVTAVAAQAAPFELIYTGTFNSQEGFNLSSAPSETFFAGQTPFAVHAWFDTTSPNLAPAPPGPNPFNGFRAYAPSLVTIDFSGQHYTIDTVAANATAGVTIAIFDQNSFTPGRYAVGLLADPVHDGAGIIGDFASASPSFIVSALTPTVFGDFFGVGHGSGVCLQGPSNNCIVNAVTPFVLRDSNNVAWNLTLGNYDQDYPTAHSPGALVGPLNTAQIVAVPEPSTYGLMLAGLAGLGWRARRRAAVKDGFLP